MGDAEMKPISFKGQNCIYAKDQPEYLPLPAFKEPDGKIISCWKMSFKERIRVLFSGVIWHSCLTFNKPLQPLKLDVLNPLKEKEKL
jgi:hypothetical protein